MRVNDGSSISVSLSPRQAEGRYVSVEGAPVLSVSWLAVLRTRSQGPFWRKLRGSIWYPLHLMDSFMQVDADSDEPPFVFLTPDQAAGRHTDVEGHPILRVSLLAKIRAENRERRVVPGDSSFAGPVYVQVGSKAFYPAAGLDDYVNGATPGTGAAPYSDPDGRDDQMQMVGYV